MEARLWHRHKLYDLGDWELRVHKGEFYEVRGSRIRSGVRRHARNTTEVEFTWGRHELYRGNAVDAIARAIEHIRFVPPEEESNIPRTFKRIKKA